MNRLVRDFYIGRCLLLTLHIAITQSMVTLVYLPTSTCLRILQIGYRYSLLVRSTMNVQCALTCSAPYCIAVRLHHFGSIKLVI